MSRQLRQQTDCSVTNSLENSVQSVASVAAWIFILVILVNVCGIIGGIASLLDRLIQGEDFVPYIGVWTAGITFFLSSFVSTRLLHPKERSVAVLVCTLLMVVGVIYIKEVLSFHVGK
jgi:hypothetical protein